MGRIRPEARAWRGEERGSCGPGPRRTATAGRRGARQRPGPPSPPGPPPTSGQSSGKGPLGEG
eukprot:2310634-Pyramimonas_sp.AAC.1